LIKAGNFFGIFYSFHAGDDAGQHPNDNPATKAILMGRQFVRRMEENANPPAKMQMGLSRQEYI